MATCDGVHVLRLLYVDYVDHKRSGLCSQRSPHSTRAGGGGGQNFTV